MLGAKKRAAPAIQFSTPWKLRWTPITNNFLAHPGSFSRFHVFTRAHRSHPRLLI